MVAFLVSWDIWTNVTRIYTTMEWIPIWTWDTRICYLNKNAPLLLSSHGGQQPVPTVSSNPDGGSGGLVSPRLKLDSTPALGPHTSQANWNPCSSENIVVENTSQGGKNPTV